MDTTQVATSLGTTPRTLRSFLRSNSSTFIAVGSGSRYEFTESDIPTLQRRFDEWRKGPRAAKTPRASRPVPQPIIPAPKRQPSRKDVEVWKEEGPVIIEDIRKPHVRARVLAEARRAEAALGMLLMSKGVHISQRGNQ